MRCKACDNKIETLHWIEARQEHEDLCYVCRSSIGLTHNGTELSEEGFSSLGDEFDELD